MMTAALALTGCDERQTVDRIGLTYMGITTMHYQQQRDFVENGVQAEFETVYVDVAVFYNGEANIYMSCKELSANIALTVREKYPQAFIDDLKKADRDLNCPRLSI